MTPTLVTDLGYKLFLMFATINVAGMGTFALLIPETKQRTLEDVSNESQDGFIRARKAAEAAA